MLCHKHALNFFNYNPKTGIITIAKKRKGSKSEGEEAGVAIKSTGYRILCFEGVKYGYHRFAWFLYFGYFPKGYIDHIDGDTANNSIINLRDVTPEESAKNRGQRYDNTSGCQGVSWNKNLKKWVSYISHNKKRLILGYFKDLSEAVSARKKAEVKYKYHKNHSRLLKK